jgi:amino acid transporter
VRSEGRGFDRLSPNGFQGMEECMNPPRLIPLVLLLVVVVAIIIYLQ